MLRDIRPWCQLSSVLLHMVLICIELEARGDPAMHRSSYWSAVPAPQTDKSPTALMWGFTHLPKHFSSANNNNSKMRSLDAPGTMQTPDVTRNNPTQYKEPLLLKDVLSWQSCLVHTDTEKSYQNRLFMAAVWPEQRPRVRTKESESSFSSVRKQSKYSMVFFAHPHLTSLLCTALPLSHRKISWKWN